jgi:peptide chain release factor 3
MTQQTLADAVARRRTFAIISHPDAGKTTLTEKLLLYGGAIHLAGSVKARRAARHATSDWMELERERGISITSSVLQFDFAGHRINLLDTPGHQDFSEDTYRTLIAADSAVMLLDNRKGIEEQTRKLFAVCHRRRTPIFVFVNKCDRVGEPPLKLLDDVESEFGLQCFPVTWPIMDAGRLVGVFDRLTRKIHLFERDAHHGSTQAVDHVAELDSDEARSLLGGDALSALRDDLELLDTAGATFDADAVLAGTLAPAFFGSALTNFGVEPFLRHFLEMAPPPGPRPSTEGPIEPTAEAFTGFVFKIQANMDPRHRDRIAFVRITSGRYEPGLEVQNTRSGEPSVSHSRSSSWRRSESTSRRPGPAMSSASTTAAASASAIRCHRTDHCTSRRCRASRPSISRGFRCATRSAASTWTRVCASCRRRARHRYSMRLRTPGPSPSWAPSAASSSTCCCTGSKPSTASLQLCRTCPTASPAG